LAWLGVEESFAIGGNLEFVVEVEFDAAVSCLGLEVLFGFAGLEIQDFYFVAHEKLDDIAKNNLIALEWVEDIQEVIDFLVKLSFGFLVFASIEEFNINDVHFSIELYKFVVCNNSIAVFVDLLEKIHELSQKSDVLAQLVVQDNIAEVMESDLWRQVDNRTA
jgi:hypothetical protein